MIKAIQFWFSIYCLIIIIFGLFGTQYTSLGWVMSLMGLIGLIDIWKNDV